VVGELNLPLAWRSRLVAATFEPLSSEALSAVESLGFVVLNLPENPGAEPPSELAEVLGDAS
jgi:hypothetical protein